jgi:hypothetical protein
MKQVWLATSADPAALVSGQYFSHQRLRVPKPAARDVERQQELLDQCARISGVSPAERLTTGKPALPAYICAVPPSTNSSMPVTKLESSDARKSAAVAISRGWPMRPIGMIETN